MSQMVIFQSFQSINLYSSKIIITKQQTFSSQTRMQAKNDQEPTLIPHHTRITFTQPKEPNIFFNSCFDSGNMSKVNRNSYDHYSIRTAADAEGTPNQGYPKSWFHFEVGGFFMRKVAFSVHRVHFLWSVSKRNHLYRPVCKVIYENSESAWQRLPHPIISLKLNEDQELVLKFDFFFSKEIKSVKFAFLYPYSYQDQRQDILRLKNQYEENQDQDVFFKQYQLIKSYQQRIVDLVIISSHEGKDGFQNIKFDQHFDLKEKLVKFRNNKPIIFVSARVHPIQTPSSFCMKGIINFLLDKKDYRAYLLRKYFVFVLVPMLNPDGVSNGHCRMDHLNQNLNRYYKTPDPIRNSSCYGVRKLCEHYQKDKRMFMYLDLHAHPATKGNFMFGNAIYDFIEQVQSQVFPKILSQNCINFEFDNCIFSRKHMKAKDKNEDMNKQGCGRVVLYKDFGIPHAYTLECGYHTNSYNNNIEKQKNIQNMYIVRYRLGKNNQKIYQNTERVYSIQTLAKLEQTIKKQDNEGRSTVIMNKNNSQINVDAFQEDQVKLRITTKSNLNEDEQIQCESKPIQKNDPKRFSKHHNMAKTKIQSNKHFQALKTRNPSQVYDGYDIFEFTSSTYDNIESDYYKRQIQMYNVESYENLGRNIMISVLDVFNKNPYSRGIDLNERRKQIAQKQSKLDRFRKEQAGIRNKMKNIVELIDEQFYSPWIKRNVFTYVQAPLQQKQKRNKTLQFQIVKSSQNKIRISNKDPVQIQTKKNLMIQSQVIKTSIGSQNADQLSSMGKFHQKNQQYDNKNTLLAKKIKSFKSKPKGLLKEYSTKQSSIQQQVTKKSIALPSSQNVINLEQQVKIIKNQGLCYSSKIIKHPSYNMASLRMRNFIMQGNNQFSGNHEGKYHHGYSLGSK